MRYVFKATNLGKQDLGVPLVETAIYRVSKTRKPKIVASSP
ncbi:MAG: hypothetical protein V7K86_27110 [Nostoc sp.]